MKCLECEHENRDGAKFYEECGHKLEGMAAPADARSSLEAERKRVTALFSDISGYTAMTSKLDPEEVKEITSRVFDGVRDVVGKYDGFIERFAGDGVLALFGVPKAHEDDPIRAIHAAMEIHELVELLSPGYESKIGRPLSMHSGVNTGVAVTADVDPAKGTHGVTGDAINVAARLSDLAQACEILVGPDTYRACQNHFTFETLSPTTVKGKSDPISIFKVLSAKAPRTRARLDRQVSSEMVGRDMDLAKLELQILKAVNGEGSVVNVIGEAGIGKSRLIAELKKRDVMKRVTLLEGRAISIGKNLSFHPLIDLLKQWARIAEDDGEPVARDKLETAIRRVCGQDTDEVFPFLATMMGMKLTGRHAERVKGIEGEALEKLILKNVRELVIKGSHLRPSVIIMEDLHWADTSSTELLDSLYCLAEKYRIVFINVLRPGYFDSDGGKVAKIAERLPVYYVGIEIRPLDKNDSETLINNMLEIKGLPYSLKNQIVERSGGNPFFIEEVVRSLVDQGVIVRRGGGFEVTDKIEKVVIPPTINDVLMARIDRLEERTRELIKIASVIGRSFFHRVLEAVADPVNGIDSRLAYLKDAQLIRDRVRMNELEYLFKHALVQEAAYESTLIRQRKALHLKVAHCIEKIFRDRLHEFYGMLAYHYSKAEDFEKAEGWMTKAGEAALRSSASSEALHYYQEALRLYLETSGHGADPVRRASLERNIGIALYNKARWAEAVEYLERILDQWGVPLPRANLRGGLGLIADLLRVLGTLYFPSREARAISDEHENEIFDLMHKVSAAMSYVDNLRQFLIVMAGLGRITKYDVARIPNGSTWWTAGAGMFSYGGISFRLSDGCLAHSLRVRVAEDVRGQTAYACMNAVQKTCAGLWEEVGSLDREVADLGLRQGDLWHISNYMWFVGLVRAEQGRFGDMADVIDRLFQMGEAYDYDLATIYARLLKADALITRLTPNEALLESDEGISYSRERSLELQAMIFMGFKGEAQLFLGDSAGSSETMSKAWEIYRKQRFVAPVFASPYLVARFLIDVHGLMGSGPARSASGMKDFRTRAYKSGRAALGTSRKYAPYRAKTLRLMGLYYWLINKQRKAMKWWDKAIKEAERLGARPDLSRTYLEVGRHLLKPESKHNHLNGIDANGYLEKAGMLFEKVGLEKDLEDLEWVRMGI